MADILNLAVPYFSLIFIGFACGKARGLPETGLPWMNFFLLYVSLPALLFGIMAKTPFEQLNNPPFLIAREHHHERIHALIIGFGQTGHAILRDLIVNCRATYLGLPRITIIDPHAKALEGVLRVRAPEIDASLLQLRTTEDVFLFGWGTDKLTYRAEDLDRILRACQPAYEDAAGTPQSSPHARFDIQDWTPLDP